MSRSKHVTAGKLTHLKRIQKLFPKVTKVLEAHAPITIEVKPKDVKGASIKDPHNCGMARACKRELKLDGVIISLSTAYTIKGDTAVRYRVPESLSREIVTFDRNHTFEPGTYTLDKSPKRRDSGERKERNYGGGPKHPYHHTTGVRAFPDRPVYGEESSDA